MALTGEEVFLSTDTKLLPNMEGGRSKSSQHVVRS